MASNRSRNCLAALLCGCLILVIGAGALAFFGVRVALEGAQRWEGYEDELRRRHEPEYDAWEAHLESELAEITGEEREAYRAVEELAPPHAVEALSRLIEAHPRCYNLYEDRAAVRRTMGDLQAALADLSHGAAVREQPGSSYFPYDDSDFPPPPFLALLELAEVHEELGDADAAIDTARSSLERDPEHPYFPLVFIGRVQCDLGRFAEALPNFERALDCDDPWLLEDERLEAREGIERALRGLGRIRDF
jgi:tetratricopeptide (TPR) repeat protein